MKYINKILGAAVILLGMSSVFAAGMPHTTSSHSGSAGRPHAATGIHNAPSAGRPQSAGKDDFAFCSTSCTENCANLPGVQQQCQQRCGRVKDQVASLQLSKINQQFRTLKDPAQKKAMLPQSPIYKCMGGGVGMPGAMGMGMSGMMPGGMGAVGADVSNMDCNSTKMALVSEIDKLKMIVQSGGAGAGGAQHSSMSGSHSGSHASSHGGSATAHATAATHGGGQPRQGRQPKQPRGVQQQQPR